MSVIGAGWLLATGLLAVPGVWNAARPLGDPTRRYSPLWLPAMVIAELASLWIAVHLVVAGVGFVSGGHRHAAGLAGLGLLGVSVLMLAWVRGRTLIGVRRLGPMVAGEIPRTRRWWGIPGVPAPVPGDLDERRDVPWLGDLTADIVLDRAERTAAPVLVYVHGGGWTGGDPRRQAIDLYHEMARSGWTVVAIRYPFAPDVSVERQIEVVRSAIAWARHDLPEVVDRSTSGVVVAGGSAGALLAAMAALTPRTHEERVDACVGLYGVYDMANRNRTRAYWGTTRHVVMQCRYRDEPERYHAVSPLDHVHADAPPFLIVHGTHDTLVPPREGEQFAEAVEAVGGAATHVEVHGAQHAWDALSSITTRTTTALIRDWLHGLTPQATEPPR
jgi:acetyl esterase/lipase